MIDAQTFLRRLLQTHEPSITRWCVMEMKIKAWVDQKSLSPPAS
ncbi:hypothetical protein RE6C_05659 [Rhodopirellula europaea 6C]|uniref:Uncharacterized protein n=1 Tax=Rhodopirellula europaea 6C TaxID=1263867 RepID=M2AAN4_9BACT|nr:hypothetical protein RE6C_05659 [Rhodopirellula europaea 6C]